jgi:hypothetical protein
LPDSLHRIAWAERLRKETVTVIQEGPQVRLNVERLSNDEAWPRSLILGDQVGLTRLSGHGYYELVWDGGQQVRRFELSNTSRAKLPVEHIELAVALAEALAGEEGPRPEASGPEAIEALFLRRMKISGAELGPPMTTLPLERLDGQPVASYVVGSVEVAWIQGGDIVACAVNREQAVALQRDERRGELSALPVRRGRLRGQALMRIPLAEVGSGGAWTRALCAWAAWLAWVAP